MVVHFHGGSKLSQHDPRGLPLGRHLVRPTTSSSSRRAGAHAISADLTPPPPPRCRRCLSFCLSTRRPQAIGDIFGSSEKTKVMGLLTSVQTSTQVFSPLIGDLADKLPERCSRHFRRRRPFVLFGHLMYCGGFIFSYL